MMFVRTSAGDALNADHIVAFRIEADGDFHKVVAVDARGGREVIFDGLARAQAVEAIDEIVRPVGRGEEPASVASVVSRGSRFLRPVRKAAS